jgi:hypothetical protein
MAEELKFLSFVLLGVLLLNSLEVASREPRAAPGPFEIQVRVEGKSVVGAPAHLGGRFAATASEGKVVFDGVPAGEYEMHIEHYDYEHHDQQIQLPAGRRETLTITMLPAPVFDLHGQYRTRGRDTVLWMECIGIFLETLRRRPTS